MAPWLTVCRAAALAASVPLSVFGQSTFVGDRTVFSTDQSGIVAGRYIVEFEPAGTGHRARDESGLDTVIQDIQHLGYDAVIKEDYSGLSQRFDGASIEILNENETSAIEDIRSITHVANVWPVHHISLNSSFELTTASAGAWNPHLMTHVDELHTRGLTGNGQRVCVVDSGIDVDHPALQGKVAGGKNLVDNNDVLEDCSGHGTFVSSVIVADHQDFHGVAPEAEIFMYKIFGCGTSTSSDLVLKGLLAADADDCDIISLSVGSNTGYRYAVTSRVASQVAQDRLVVVAAGNDGGMGPYFASSPAVAPGVLSVGSVEAEQVIAWPAVLISSNGEGLNVSYVTPNGFKYNDTLDVPVHLDDGDSCNIQGYGDVDTAVLSKRGVCVGRGSARSAEMAGYGYALAFDAYGQGVYYEYDVDEYYWGALKLFAVTASSVGAWAAEQVADGNTLRLRISVDAKPTASDAIDIPAAGHMSDFSSWGPSYENDLAPYVSAPGGAVYGAFPDGVFAISSGTSFSTPYVAGVAALYYAHVKKDKAAFIKRIVTTSQALPAYSSYDKKVIAELGPVAQQGAGLINAASVLDHKIVLLSDPVLHLNDTDNRINTLTIRIQNNGDEEVTFNITHAPASTVSTRSSTWYINEYFPPLTGDTASLEAPGVLVVAAGATKEIQVTLSAPTGVGTDSGALWSGKVVLQGSNDEVISIPYLGVEASTYEWGTLHHGPEVYRYDSNNGYLYPVDHWGVPYRPSEGDSPEVWFAFRYGTYEFSIDIVGEDWTTDQFVYPPTAGAGSDAWYGPIRQQVLLEWDPNDFPMREIVRFSRGAYVTFRSLANGTNIPSGRYRIFSRALRMFGDASNPDDWQLFLSDSFPVQLGDDPVPGPSSTSALPSSTSVYSSTGSSESTIATSTTSSGAAETSVPGTTTTLSAEATPTGLADAITSLRLQRLRDPSPMLPDPGDWMELRIVIDLPLPVPADSVISFGIPDEIVDIASDSALQASNARAGATSFDPETRLFTVSLDNWTTWNKNMVGDFYIMCRFDPEFAARMQPGTYVLQFPVVGGIIESTIYHGAIDRTAVYERLLTLPYDSTTLFSAEIEVPASMGPWDSVQLEAALSDDDGFVCDESGVYTGRASCGDRRMRRITDVTEGSISTCSTKTFRAKHEGGLEDNEVLRFTVAGIQGNWNSWTFGFTYALDVQLSNGTTVYHPYKTINFEKNARTRSAGFAAFTGERA